MPPACAPAHFRSISTCRSRSSSSFDLYIRRRSMHGIYASRARPRDPAIALLRSSQLTPIAAIADASPRSLRSRVLSSFHHLDRCSSTHFSRSLSRCPALTTARRCSMSRSLTVPRRQQERVRRQHAQGRPRGRSPSVDPISRQSLNLLAEGGDDGTYQSDAQADGTTNPTLAPREQSCTPARSAAHRR